MAYGQKVDVYGDCILHTVSFLIMCVRCTAFGVTMYEMMAMQAPWYGVQTTEIYRKVHAGERPSAGYPDDQSIAEWTKLMQQCWAQDADDRPMFSEILERLQTMKDECQMCMERTSSSRSTGRFTVSPMASYRSSQDFEGSVVHV